MHTQHVNASGLNLPSVSQIPAIFAQDLTGFEDWICRELGPHAPCCTQAKRQFYQESANLGNDIHELMAAFLQGERFEDGVPEYQAAVFEPVAKFFKESDYHPLGYDQIENELAVECKMTGKEFGGTLDTAGTFSKPWWEKERKTLWANDCPEVRLSPATSDIWIVDLKIKSKLDCLHPLQLYGYATLLKECYGLDAKWGLIIRREKKLDKTPEIQKKAYYLPLYKEYWNASMKMWRFINGKE
jgi:hypothetical protein